MNRIRKSFKEEEDSSMNFLAKLSQFKESAQQQKKKTSMINHKAEWQRDMERFNKLETALTNEVGFACMTVDRLVGMERLSQIFEEEDDDEMHSYFAKNEDYLEKRRDEVIDLKERIRSLKAAVLNRPVKSSLKQKKVQDGNGESQAKQLKEFLSQQSEYLEKEISLLINDTSSQKIDTFRLEVEISSAGAVETNDDILLKNTHSQVGHGHTSKLQQFLDSEVASSLVKDEDEIIAYLKLTWNDEDVDPTKHEKKLIDQYRKALNLMNERYRLEINVLDAEYEGKGRTEPPEFFQKSCHLEQFRHIQKCYSIKGKEREFYMERLQLHFPKQKKLELEIMDSIVCQSDFKQQRLDALFRNYHSERSELKRKAEQQVQDMLTETINEAKRKADRLQLQVERDRIHAELEEKREAFMIKKQQQLDIQRQIEAEQEEEEKKKLEIYHAHVKEQKQKAKQYEIMRIQRENEEKEKIQQLEIEQKRELHELVLKNKVKVDTRQEIFASKQESKQEMKELQEREKQLNNDRIERAIESYSCRPSVLPDPKRLKQPTQANIIKKQTKYDKADKIALTQVHGFTVNQLMSDMRYKVSAALSDAGLSNTQHAKDVLRYLHNK